MDDLLAQARARSAILHASSAWGSDEDGILIDALVAEIKRLQGALVTYCIELTADEYGDTQ